MVGDLYYSRLANRDTFIGAAADDHEAEIKSTTLTVALGRYKKVGAVRIVKRNWYYVPENERHIQVAVILQDSEEQDAPPEQSSEAS